MPKCTHPGQAQSFIFVKKFISVPGSLKSGMERVPEPSPIVFFKEFRAHDRMSPRISMYRANNLGPDGRDDCLIFSIAIPGRGCTTRRDYYDPALGIYTRIH